MNITTGAWLAAAAGCITGGIAAFMRGRSPSRGSLTVTAVLGMLIAALGYGAFQLAGFAVSFLTFSGPPDAVLDTRRADRVSDARHKDSRGVRVDRSDSGAERDRCRP